MKWFCIASSVALVLCGWGLANAGDVPKARAMHVVLISIDGLAASYLEDPRAELPTLKMLAKRGAAAKGMIGSFPSVTWPCHTSLATGVSPGKHGVIGNTVWLRDKQRVLSYSGDPELTKDQAVHVPTLFDGAKQRGLKTAAFYWPCTTAAKNLDWVIPEVRTAAGHAKFNTPGLNNELASAGIDLAYLGTGGKESAATRDELFTRATCYLLEKHQVNLTLLHPNNVDGVQHANGPQTPAAYQAVAHADRLVKDVWETLQKQPFADRAAIFVVSDHGFAPEEKLIHPNVALKEAGLVETDKEGKVTERRVWCIGGGGSTFVYILDQEHKQELLAQAKESLGKLEGVESILGPDQFPKLGLPDPTRNAEMGDLVLTTGPGYSFEDKLTGTETVTASSKLKGTHGHLPQLGFMQATFIAAGAGIKPGVQLETIQNIDVAPTIANLLGFTMPEAEGRVLTEILKD